MSFGSKKGIQTMNQSTNGTVVNVSKKKRTGRFNLIDLIFVVIILLLIATVLYVFSPFQWIQTMAKSQTKTIQYTVEITGVEEAFINKIKKNDVVVDAVTKNNLGTVSQDIDYHTKYSELGYEIDEESGTATGVFVEYPNRYNLIITISATADYIEEKGYTVNGRRIAVGEKISIRFPDYTCEGYCIGLTPMQ